MHFKYVFLTNGIHNNEKKLKSFIGCTANKIVFEMSHKMFSLKCEEMKNFCSSVFKCHFE